MVDLEALKAAADAAQQRASKAADEMWDAIYMQRPQRHVDLLSAIHDRYEAQAMRAIRRYLDARNGA